MPPLSLHRGHNCVSRVVQYACHNTKPREKGKALLYARTLWPLATHNSLHPAQYQLRDRERYRLRGLLLLLLYLLRDLLGQTPGRHVRELHTWLQPLKPFTCPQLRVQNGRSTLEV